MLTRNWRRLVARTIIRIAVVGAGDVGVTTGPCCSRPDMTSRCASSYLILRDVTQTFLKIVVKCILTTLCADSEEAGT